MAKAAVASDKKIQNKKSNNSATSKVRKTRNVNQLKRELSKTLAPEAQSSEETKTPKVIETVPTIEEAKSTKTEVPAKKLSKISRNKVTMKIASHTNKKFTLEQENMFLSDRNFVPRPFKAKPLDPKIYSSSACGQHGVPNYKSKKTTKAISPKLGRNRDIGGQSGTASLLQEVTNTC